MIDSDVIRSPPKKKLKQSTISFGQKLTSDDLKENSEEIEEMKKVHSDTVESEKAISIPDDDTEKVKVKHHI